MIKRLFKLSAIIIFCLYIICTYVEHINIKQLNEYNEWEKTIALKSSQNKYWILVDLEDSKLYLLEDGKPIKTYPCAGGKYSTPSPIGTWKIISKDTWGEGFGGRWMGLNVPWGKFGIHGTIYPNSIGWHSSHGCIRMYNKNIKELYKIVPHGTKVTIVDGPYGPFGKGIRTLQPGQYGADVMEVQKKLKELGYYNAWVDGKYGDYMKSAVHRFQKDNKLPITNKVTRQMYNKLGLFEFE